MRLPTDLQEDISKVLQAALKFVLSLVLSTILVGSSILLEALFNLSLQEGSKTQELIKVVLEVSLGGSAVVISVCGSLVVAGEVVRSTLKFFRRTKE